MVTGKAPVTAGHPTDSTKEKAKALPSAGRSPHKERRQQVTTQTGQRKETAGHHTKKGDSRSPHRQYKERRQQVTP